MAPRQSRRGAAAATGRPRRLRESGAGDERAMYDVVWHVMLYCGVGSVIGACDIAGAVTVRPMEYQPALGHRQWRYVEPTPFRTLNLRGATGRNTSSTRSSS